MGTWNYRVIKYDHINEDDYRAIHEVHYTNDKPTSLTEKAASVDGEDLEWVLSKMKEALSKPVLNWTDIVGVKSDGC